MAEQMIEHALQQRVESREVKFFTRNDIDHIKARLGAPVERLSVATNSQRSQRSQRRRQGAGGVVQEGGVMQQGEQGAKEFSRKLLAQFRVGRAADGEQILLRQVSRGGEQRWCPVVALEDLPVLIQQHRENATGFSGINKTYSHVSRDSPGRGCRLAVQPHPHLLPTPRVLTSYPSLPYSCTPSSWPTMCPPSWLLDQMGRLTPCLAWRDSPSRLSPSSLRAAPCALTSALPSLPSSLLCIHWWWSEPSSSAR